MTELEQDKVTIPTKLDLEHCEESMISKPISEQGFQSKFQIWRNLLAVCICFMLLFTSFQSLQTLQSSLFIDDGMGTTVLAVLYSSFVLSTFFVPSIVINCLGCKWTIAVAMLGYCCYMLAHFYATWALFIPAAIIAGICAGPLWTAQSTFINLLADDYSRITESKKNAATNFMFGIFFFFYQAAFIWGHIISSQVLARSDDEINGTTFASLTEEELSRCGHNFCPAEAIKSNNTNLAETPKEKIYLLSGLYTLSAFLAVIIIIVVLQQHPSEHDKGLRCSRDSCQVKNLVATFVLLKDYRLLMLIPLTCYGGLQSAFLFSDVTQALITCPLGKWWVGPVLISYGVCTASSSLLFGKVVRYTGRVPLFILAACIHSSLIITGILFDTTQTLYPYMLYAGFWGVGVGIWKPQLNALYGILFKSNTKAAYSNYKLWDSAGSIVQYLYQSRLCFTYKAYILLVAMSIGLTGYIMVEVLEYRKDKREKDNCSSDSDDSDTKL